MDRPNKSEEATKETIKKGCAAFIAGAAVMFVICLTIGILDAFGYLDPILDFLGIK